MTLIFGYRGELKIAAISYGHSNNSAHSQERTYHLAHSMHIWNSRALGYLKTWHSPLRALQAGTLYRRHNNL